jgi:carbonic anhydrase/acetyltransferase-like protein (isoleucine patch superfamily)
MKYIHISMRTATTQSGALKPKFGNDVYISENAVVLGNVTIGDNVFIAPNATIRCDEPGSEIIIGPRCNIQDNVVIHSLTGCKVLIGAGTSIGHGSIVHGPCEIGERCFVGFGSVVFKSVLGDDVMVMHRALVEDASIPRGMGVPSGAMIKGIDDHSFVEVGPEMIRFSDNVRNVNIELARSYKQMAGSRADEAND